MSVYDSRSLAPTWIAVVSLFEGGSLLAFAVLHVAAERLGFITTALGPVLVVESLCGAFLLVAAYATATGRQWAWPVALGAHGAAIVGVLVGITTLARTASGAPENAVFHPFMLAVLVPTTAYLLTRSGRRNLLPVG
ncbi:MAG TPA: hypothetical protein VNB06_03290 [Thermoanaerobaculia bacterium]|nr:hypothetical protein [Thermoanaerobaculia bacterium]